MNLRIAAVAWKIRPTRRDSSFFGHFHDLVSEAHDEGAEVVVFPELPCLEMLPIVPDLEEANVARYLVQYGQAIEEWIGRISESSGLVIVGGSHFRQTERGIVSACAVGIPGQGVVIAEKNNLTTYERAVWRLSPGHSLVRLPKRLGVTIGYDGQFPAAASNLAGSGVQVLAVPSFTETAQSFQRSRWSCLARAIENQIFVVHASLVGQLGRPPVSQTSGSAAILSPCVEPFFDTAVIRETAMGEEGVILADLNFELLADARNGGASQNWNDRDSGDWRLVGEPFPEPDSDEGPNLGGVLN